MYHRPRLIPCLLLSDGGLVKTVRFKDPNYLGDPINAVKIFSEKCVTSCACRTSRPAARGAGRTLPCWRTSPPRRSCPCPTAAA